MKDPYILENGTLNNLLGIEEYEELKQAETDIGYVKLLDVDQEIKRNCDIDVLKRVHKHIFGDIFAWAGEFRTVPIYKEELVIPGISLQYAEPEQIETLLAERLNEMNSYDWKNKNIDEITKAFTGFLARIWRVHPFRDGNTRTTLAFANIFAKQHGFEMNMENILDNLGRVQDPQTGRVLRWSVRDKFVLAALDEKDYPEPEALEEIIKKSIGEGITKKIDSLNKIMEER